MKRWWLLSILLVPPSVSGCGCDLILNIYVEPKAVALSVGETTPPPRISTQGCYEPRRAVTIAAWESQNPEIVAVDADTGVMTGVAPGETTVTGYEEEDQRGAFGFPVTVVAAAR